jgi:hypothetical protein
MYIRRLSNFTLWPLCAQEKKPGTHWVGGWVAQRAGLDILKKRKSFASALIAQPCKRKFFLIIYFSVR